MGGVEANKAAASARPSCMLEEGAQERAGPGADPSPLIPTSLLPAHHELLQRENESEKAETREKVEEDRKPQIEAAIVRIMKVRRRHSITACSLRRGRWSPCGRLTRQQGEGGFSALLSSKLKNHRVALLPPRRAARSWGTTS